jgi:hypothetical protein
MEVNSQFLIPVTLLRWKEAQIRTAYKLSGSQDKYKRGYEKENPYPTSQSDTSLRFVVSLLRKLHLEHSGL